MNSIWFLFFSVFEIDFGIGKRKGFVYGPYDIFLYSPTCLLRLKIYFANCLLV